MKKLFKTSLLIVSILICIVCIAVPAGFLYLNSNSAARYIQTKVNALIPGSLLWQKHHVSLFRGEIDFQKIALNGKNNEEIVTADRFFVKLSLPALMKKRVDISALALERPCITLKADSNGVLNVTSAFVDPDAVQKEYAKDTSKANNPYNILIRKFTLDSAAVSFSTGNGEITINTEGISIEASGNLLTRHLALDLQISSASLSVNSIAFELNDCNLKATIDEDRIEPLSLNLSSATSKLSLNGRIDSIFTKPAIFSSLSIHADLEELRQSLQLKQPYSGDVVLDLTVQGAPGNPEAALRVEYGGGTIAGTSIDNARASIALLDRVAHIDTLDVTAASGSVQLLGDVDLRETFQSSFLDSVSNFDKLSYNAEVKLNQISLQKLAGMPDGLKGSLSSTISLKGAGVRPDKLDGSLSLSVSADDFLSKGAPSPVDANITGDVVFGQGITTVHHLTATIGGSPLHARGTIDYNTQTIDASVSLDTTDLDKLLALAGIDSIGGKITLNADFSGPLSNPSAECSIGAGDLIYGNYTVGDITAAAALDSSGKVTLSTLSLKNNETRLQATGSIKLFKEGTLQAQKNPLIDAVIGKSTIFIEDFIDGIHARVVLDAHIHGSPKNLQGEISVQGNSIDFGVQRLEEISLSALLDSQRIVLQPLTVTVAPPHSTSITGWISFDKHYNLALSCPTLPMQSIDAIADSIGLDGVVSIDLSGNGTFKDPAATGTIRVSNIMVQEKAVHDITLNIDFHNQLATVEGKSDFSLTGLYVVPDKEFTVTSQFDRTELAPYFALANQKNLHGTVTGILNASGQTDDLEHVQATLDVSHCAVFQKEIKAVTTKNLLVTLTGDRISIPPAHITLLKNGSLSVSGDGAIDGELDFNLAADIPLSLAGLFTEDFSNAEGNVSINAALKGSRTEPDLRAKILLTDIAFPVTSISQKLHNGAGSITVTPTQITIDTISGKLSEGSFAGTGTIDLDSLKPVQMAFKSSLQNVLIQVPDMLDILVNASLIAEGSPDTAAIRGEIEMLEGLYYKDVVIDLLGGIGKKKRKIKKEPEEISAPFLRNMNFDVNLKSRKLFIVENNIAQMEINPDLQLVGSINRPVINGRVNVSSGTLSYLRKTFTVQRGIIDFLNPYAIETTIDIEGSIDIRQWHIVLNTTGSPDELVFTLSAVPELEHEDIISLLALGKTTYEINRGDLMSSTSSSEQLLAQLIDATLSQGIKEATGLDVFDIKTGSNNGSKSSNAIQVTVGKELTKRLTTKYLVETQKGELTQRAIVEYKILENLLLQTFSDDDGNFGGETQFKWEFR